MGNRPFVLLLHSSDFFGTTTGDFGTQREQNGGLVPLAEDRLKVFQYAEIPP